MVSEIRYEIECGKSFENFGWMKWMKISLKFVTFEFMANVYKINYTYFSNSIDSLSIVFLVENLLIPNTFQSQLSMVQQHIDLTEAYFGRW